MNEISEEHWALIQALDQPLGSEFPKPDLSESFNYSIFPSRGSEEALETPEFPQISLDSLENRVFQGDFSFSGVSEVQFEAPSIDFKPLSLLDDPNIESIREMSLESLSEASGIDPVSLNSPEIGFREPISYPDTPKIDEIKPQKPDLSSVLERLVDLLDKNEPKQIPRAGKVEWDPVREWQ